MSIVVDTSILIDYLRGGTKWEEFIVNGSKEDKKLLLPTVVIFELFSGSSTKNLHKQTEIIDFLKQFQKMDLDETIARRAGELFRDTRIKVQVPDYIVAASALQTGSSVLTLNKKHFEQFIGLPLYPI